MDLLGVDAAAAVTGFPRGSLGTMVSRGQIRGFPYELVDLCSLMAAKQLVDRGMHTTPACAIARAMREHWREVMLADNEPEPRQRKRWLAVASNPPGDEVPYTWTLLPPNEELVNFLADGDVHGPVILVQASDIVRDVLVGIRDWQRAQGR